MPTDEEEAAIQRGIALDPDAAGLTDEELAEMRPASEMMPPKLYADLTRRRGPAQRPAKIQVTLRLPADLVETLRATGPGWHGRIEEAVRKLAKG